MLSQSRNEQGYLLETVTVYFNILPESNPIHVKDVFKIIGETVSHITKGDHYHTFDIEMNMNMLDIERVPENKIGEVVSLVEAILIVLANQGAINQYVIQ